MKITDKQKINIKQKASLELTSLRHFQKRFFINVLSFNTQKKSVG